MEDCQLIFCAVVQKTPRMYHLWHIRGERIIFVYYQPKRTTAVSFPPRRTPLFHSSPIHLGLGRCGVGIFQVVINTSHFLLLGKLIHKSAYPVRYADLLSYSVLVISPLRVSPISGSPFFWRKNRIVKHKVTRKISSPFVSKNNYFFGNSNGFLIENEYVIITTGGGADEHEANVQALQKMRAVFFL